MKVRIQIKDPDVLHESIHEALEDLKIEGVEEDELELIKEQRFDAALELCEKWFEYGEYFVLEVDTEKKTCIVLPVQK